MSPTASTTPSMITDAALPRPISKNWKARS